MGKKRLVFTLLYQQGGFYLSRNFRLQRIGDLGWLHNNYRFLPLQLQSMNWIVDVSREQSDRSAFCDVVSQVSANCFMPLVLRGGIVPSDAELLVSNGADKLLLNTSLATNPELVRGWLLFASQCIIASVDYRLENGSFVVYSHHGQQCLGHSLHDYIKYLFLR